MKKYQKVIIGRNVIIGRIVIIRRIVIRRNVIRIVIGNKIIGRIVIKKHTLIVICGKLIQMALNMLITCRTLRKSLK
ncbi:hypothetical protein NUSPORA_02791 [Nucleospora cyclopteri]